MLFEWFKGNLLENGRRYAKSDNRVQKGLKERIPNHILHVQFERKISVSQSNQICCTHNMEYTYIITLNDRKCQNASKCLLPNGTERKKTSSQVNLGPSNAFGLSRSIFLSRTMGKGGGRDFRLCPLLAPQGILDQTGTMHN